MTLASHTHFSMSPLVFLRHLIFILQEWFQVIAESVILKEQYLFNDDAFSFTLEEGNRRKHLIFLLYVMLDIGYQDRILLNRFCKLFYCFDHRGTGFCHQTSEFVYLNILELIEFRVSLVKRIQSLCRKYLCCVFYLIVREEMQNIHTKNQKR